MDLSNLHPPEGARRKRKRIGRGEGSGTGVTAGRGHKGAKSRSGFKRKRGFEGGQMPLHRRLPKRGFKNIFGKRYNAVNVGRVQQAIDAGKLDAGQTITAEVLKVAGVVTHLRDGVRLLGKGDLSAKVSIEVGGASKGAIAAVEKAGGSVTVLVAKKAKASKD
jgi:large subunit ribosomal protein L15